jgi:peptidoglycan/LPS O-acetylase OafA/YrhL
MIQRQQTLWLLLATLAAAFSFMFPFVVGEEMQKNLLSRRIVDAGSNFFILLLTVGSLILSTVIIFLFKNRKQQMQLCLLGVLVSIGIIAMYVLQMNKLVHTTLALSCVLPFIVAAGYFMSYRNIRKDEKLVKSLDKLR